MESSTSTRTHTAFKELPQIDISELNSTDAIQRQSVADKLGKAAREVGFLYITGHGVDADLTENLKARAREFFAKPLAHKMRYYIGQSINHSGYVPEGEERLGEGKIDHKEAYDINFDYLEEHGRKPMLGPNQWPEDEAFKRDVKAYYEAAIDASHMLFRGFALALGLPEDTLTKLVTAPPSQLRLIHYPFNADATQDSPGIGAHTDYECFTILLPTAPGLEVLNGAGEWIDVPLIENAFVINIGDMLEILSNGEFVATAHRVRKVQQERYSFPLFCSCDYDTVISPIPREKSSTKPAVYDSLKCGDHLYAQTVQTFQYLKNRLANGEIQLPEGSKAVSSFGHQTASKV